MLFSRLDDWDMADALVERLDTAGVQTHLATGRYGESIVFIPAGAPVEALLEERLPVRGYGKRTCPGCDTPTSMSESTCATCGGDTVYTNHRTDAPGTVSSQRLRRLLAGTGLGLLLMAGGRLVCIGLQR